MKRIEKAFENKNWNEIKTNSNSSILKFRKIFVAKCRCLSTATMYDIWVSVIFGELILWYSINVLSQAFMC